MEAMELTDKTIEGSNGKKWHLLKYLGCGSCCEVYSALLEDRSLVENEKVAVKVFKLGEKYAAASFRERELLYLVRKMRGPSPYIVELYDYFRWNGQCCLVEELLDFDLKGLYCTNLTLQDLYKITCDISRGLEELHSCGFVHADIKPSNIMWSSRTNTYKLIDFSLSFHQQDKYIPVIQSRAYRAPEVDAWNEYITSVRSQPLGHNSAETMPTCGVTIPGPSCDLWSLGRVLNNLLERQCDIPASTTEPDSH